MAVDHNNPQSRDEEILIATIDGKEYDKAPQSRMEELLLELKETIEEGGGGGGGTTNYNNLSNKPQVNGETLIGDKTGADLGLVDAEDGKGLSTNDYDDTEKAAVAAATSAIAAIKDGSELDSFGDVEVALLDKADTSDLGTAAAKNSTNSVTSGSTDLVESGAVKDAIDSAVSRAYHHAGTKTVAQLTHDLLVTANEGNVYEMTDSGTTTSDFMEGIGKPIKEGDNVGVARVSEGVYKFDLLSGFVNTTNFVQKSQTAGLLKNDGTVNDEIEGDIGSLMSGLTTLDTEVNGDATTYPYADVITIPDAVPSNLADCSVKIEPDQNLHGYDKPWVGGAGKNKLPLVLADIKTANTYGTWSGNVYTHNSVTFTVLTDSDDNVTGINVNGTTSDYSRLELATISNASGKVLNGCPSGGSSSGYKIRVANTSDVGVGEDIGSGYTIPSDATFKISINVGTGTTVSNQMFYPMIRLSTETDATFAPYTNICPITGYTEASVQRDGKNWFDVGNSINDWIATNMDGAKISSSSISSKVTATISRATGSVKVTNYDTTNWLWMSKELKFQKNTSYKLRNISGIPMKILGFNSLDAYTIGTQIIPTDGVYNSGDYDYWIISFFPNNLQFENAMIVLATETDATFEPYQGKTYTIALGDTIYGGTVDFKTGVMTVDRAFAEFDGSNDETWELYNRGSASAFAMYIDIANIMSVLSGTYLKSNYLNKITVNQTWGDYDYWVSAETGHLVTGIKAITTVSDWKTYLVSNPLQVCYELATPLTIQLTPQQIQLLKGANTLTASTGDISVTVNGVSGSIGAMQEQVNGLAEDVALKQNATDNSLETEAKTIVGAINEHEGDIGTLKSGLTNLSKGYFKASVTSGKWYKIADMTASTWIIHSGIIAIGGVLLKKFTFRYDATNHTFNNNFTKLESITGLPGYMAMKFGDNAVTLYYKAGQIGTATYSVLTDGEEGAVNYYNFVETDLTDADMDLIES